MRHAKRGLDPEARIALMLNGAKRKTPRSRVRFLFLFFTVLLATSFMYYGIMLPISPIAARNRSITLVVSYFVPGKNQTSHPHRKEIEAVIASNLENSYISNVVVILDGVRYGNNCTHFKKRIMAGVTGGHARLICVNRADGQSTYFEMFEYAVKFQGDITILSNADMAFDSTVNYLRDMPGDALYTIATQGYDPLRAPKDIRNLKDKISQIVNRVQRDRSIPSRCATNWPDSWDSFVFKRGAISSPLNPSDFQDLFDGRMFFMNEYAAEYGALSGVLRTNFLRIRNVCDNVSTWHIHYAEKTHRSENVVRYRHIVKAPRDHLALISARRPDPRGKYVPNIIKGRLFGYRWVPSLKEKKSRSNGSSFDAKLPPTLDYLTSYSRATSACIPFFWHVPKSAGITMRVVAKHVFFLHPSDLGTNEQITQLAEKLKDGPRENIENFNYVHTPLLHQAGKIMKAIGKDACAAAVLRHPIKRLVSLFDYLAFASWESTYDPSMQNITVDDYVAQNRYEENWMTRMLSNRQTGRITDKDLAVAKQALGKIIVGFVENMPQFVNRLAQYWDMAPLSMWQTIRVRNILSSGRNKNKRKKSVLSEKSKSILLRSLHYDIKLYEYAKNILWPAQAFRASSPASRENRRGENTLPIFVVGLPKSGTGTLRQYFQCGGLKWSHWSCGKVGPCGQCIKRNIDSGHPALENCGDYDAYTQMDSECTFPQVQYLENIYKQFPDATWILNLRPAVHWVSSVTHWHDKDYRKRFTRCDLPGLPRGVGDADSEMVQFYERQTARVRKFARNHPSIRLVEIQIEEKSAADTMQREFPQIPLHCWGHVNKNEKAERGRTQAARNIENSTSRVLLKT